MTDLKNNLAFFMWLFSFSFMSVAADIPDDSDDEGYYRRQRGEDVYSLDDWLPSHLRKASYVGGAALVTVAIIEVVILIYQNSEMASLIDQQELIIDQLRELAAERGSAIEEALADGLDLTDTISFIADKLSSISSNYQLINSLQEAAVVNVSNAFSATQESFDALQDLVLDATRRVVEGSAAKLVLAENLSDIINNFLSDLEQNITATVETIEAASTNTLYGLFSYCMISRIYGMNPVLGEWFNGAHEYCYPILQLIPELREVYGVSWLQ